MYLTSPILLADSSAVCLVSFLAGYAEGIAVSAENRTGFMMNSLWKNILHAILLTCLIFTLLGYFNVAINESFFLNDSADNFSDPNGKTAIAIGIMGFNTVEIVNITRARNSSSISLRSILLRTYIVSLGLFLASVCLKRPHYSLLKNDSNSIYKNNIHMKLRN